MSAPNPFAHEKPIVVDVTPDEQCPRSERIDGDHCACSWEQDICHWCGKEWGER